MTEKTNNQPGAAFKKPLLRKRGEQRQTQRRGNSIRESIVRIDQELLQLLLQRYRLLNRISQDGHLSNEDEKFLRENWQKQAARMSRDPLLSNNLFTILQTVAIEPIGTSSGTDESSRTAFTLFPIRKPLDLNMAIPAARVDASALLYMACASGQKIELDMPPDNVPMSELLHLFDQLSVKMECTEKSIRVFAGPPLGTPDKALFTGGDEFNFFLLLAHYLGRPSRVRFNGEKNLKLANLCFLDRVLPVLGARIVHIVPGSNGLPVRMECSGLLPPVLQADNSMPPSFLSAILLAAPFYEQPFAIDFARHAHKSAIFARLLPLLEKTGLTFTVDGATISLEPGFPSLSVCPEMPMNVPLAAFIGLFAELSGGIATLNGYLPDNADDQQLECLASILRLDWQCTHQGLKIRGSKPPAQLSLELPADISLTEWQKIWLLAYFCGRALQGVPTRLPQKLAGMSQLSDFTRALHLQLDSEGQSLAEERSEDRFIWNAPSPLWALALAAMSCCITGNRQIYLGNPAIISDIWAPFWKWYNSLIKCSLALKDESKPALTPRRRIVTRAIAVPPPIREE